MRKALGVVVVLLAVLLAGALFAGCGSSPKGTVRVMLTDHPINAIAINVIISRVDVIREGEGIETIVDEPQTFELLSLAGAEALLGTAGVTPGHYEQIRLIVDSATITTPEGTFPLEIPSGEQTGIKLVCDFDVLEGQIIVLVLDFDAAKSVHATPPGSNNWQLQPVIHVIPQNVAGRVIGVLDPAEARSSASVTLTESGTSTEVGTAYPNEEDGSFAMIVRAGTYDLHASAEGYQTYDQTDVVVTAEQDTDVGTITLVPEAP